MNYFVTAIGTDSGKTIVSSVLCEMLKADYWKPVQSGLPRDTEVVSGLVSNPFSKFHKERYLLSIPVSPHAAAKKDDVLISLDDFQMPETSCDLIIEGAGGCLVPLNDKDFTIDLATRFQATVVLVANHYLGSINHTLLTVEALKNRNHVIKGIIFNGDPNPESERIILRHTSLKCLLQIEKEKIITIDVIKKYARTLQKHWHE